MFPETGRPQNIFEYTGHTPVNIRLGESPAAHRFYNLSRLNRFSRHHQVVAGMYLCHGVTFSDPVRHDKTFVAPFVAQNSGQQLAALLRIRSVDTIVGRHDRPRTPLLDGDLESSQINLTQRTLRHPGVIL